MTTADGPGSDNAPQLARDDATTPVLRELRDADAARLAAALARGLCRRQRTVVAGADHHAGAGLDAVVRFHDMARLNELGRAIFSLVGQSHRPLRILLALQRFDAAAQDALREILTPLVAGSDAVLELLNYDRPAPADARSELVNLGFAAAT